MIQFDDGHRVRALDAALECLRETGSMHSVDDVLEAANRFLRFLVPAAEKAMAPPWLNIPTGGVSPRECVQAAPEPLPAEVSDAARADGMDCLRRYGLGRVSTHGEER